MKRNQLEWRLINCHTLQTKATPVEWQIITSALEEQGITFGMRATESIKRIQTFKEQGNCYVVRFSHPLQDSKARMQLTAKTTEKTTHSEGEVLSALQGMGIKVETGILLQKVQPEEKGGALYNFAYLFEIDTQTDLQSYCLAKEVAEQGQPIRIGGADH